MISLKKRPVLANLEGLNFKSFLFRRRQPWWRLLRYYIIWPYHFKCCAAAPVVCHTYTLNLGSMDLLAFSSKAPIIVLQVKEILH